MSRSHRAPSFSSPHSNGMGEFKAKAARKFRRLGKNLKLGDDFELENELPNSMKEVSDLWVSPDDGRHGFHTEAEVLKYHNKPHKIGKK